MLTCFVMQPFDKGKFDKRYDDVFKPAIEAAGLEPYRVDADPGVSIPIAEIERGIRSSALCFAEITEDNPNVWFELGFAIACNKDVVMVCSEERQAKFPFDVQHRSIIKYGTQSSSDFRALIPTLEKGFEARLEFVRESLADKRSRYVKAHEHLLCQGLEHLRAELTRLEALGGEGLMLRRPGSRYESGRSTTLVKVKNFHDGEAQVLKHLADAGRHKGRLGALLVEMADGTSFSWGQASRTPSVTTRRRW